MEVCEEGVEWVWTEVSRCEVFTPSLPFFITSRSKHDELLRESEARLCDKKRHATCNASSWASFFPRGSRMGGSRTNQFFFLLVFASDGRSISPVFMQLRVAFWRWGPRLETKEDGWITNIL